MKKKLIRIIKITKQSQYFEQRNQLEGKVAWARDLKEHDGFFSAWVRFISKTGIKDLDDPEQAYLNAIWGFHFIELNKKIRR